MKKVNRNLFLPDIQSNIKSIDQNKHQSTMKNRKKKKKIKLK